MECRSGVPEPLQVQRELQVCFCVSAFRRPSEMQAALEVARQDREMAEQRGGGS